MELKGLMLRISPAALCACYLSICHAEEARKVVNIVNFVRSADPRPPREEMLKAVREEVALNRKYGFDNTILLQYDALVDEEMMGEVMKSDREKTEYGIWFEMSRPLNEAAGLEWKPGEKHKDWDWDWHIAPGFLMAYDHAGRKALVDTAFAKFKETFGAHPKSVGAWLLDAWSMDYMQTAYGVEGFCICREQDNTDAYGLRGGYSNGAYYPSKRNMLSAATDMDNAVKAPVFRMLTPDPIYNYGRVDKMYPPRRYNGAPTLEPVTGTGSNPKAVDWLFRVYTQPQALMNLSYMQAGQENSFGWRLISRGWRMQCAKIAEEASAGRIVVEKLRDTARAFAAAHKSNCPQTQVALDDWSGEGRRSVWFNSRFYRANLFMEGKRLFFRDIHIMSDDFEEPYLDKVCTGWQALYYTPPVVDQWMFRGKEESGAMTLDGDFSEIKAVREGDALVVTATRVDGTCSTVRFDEGSISVKGASLEGEYAGGDFRDNISVTGSGIGFGFMGFSYFVPVDGEVRKTAKGFRIGGGNIVLDMSRRSFWDDSEWISAPDAPVAHYAQRAADGVSWFVREVRNPAEIKRAVWTTTALGVYEVYVNGRRIGEEVLKPGFTHVEKTRLSSTFDVTDFLKKEAGARNFFAAEVSSGWWRDRIVNFHGRKSAFRGILKLEFADGTEKRYGTKAGEWMSGTGGSVVHAGIFDGETYDARVAAPYEGSPAFGPAVRNNEFCGGIYPSDGSEVHLRRDLALVPKSMYAWQGVDGDDEKRNVFGRIRKTRDVKIGEGGEFEAFTLRRGETLVVDFGQNCAGVPEFSFKAAEGTVLTCLPAEMLNDANGERSRGNDGPAGSVYRENLRMKDGMRIVYVFGAGDGFASYMPRHTFFGYRYVSVSATDDVTIGSVRSIPLSSIAKDKETGRIVTGSADVNRLISNVRWGQLSNYLSVPTDCPQRNERCGWTADTQVFAEAGSFNADTAAFLRKWMRDMRDSQDARGGFPGVAPWGMYGGKTMRFGWSDAGVIVPYQIWKQFGDVQIIDENWAAMERFVARVNETKYDHDAIKGESGGYQWADWLSYEDYESSSRRAMVGNEPRDEAKLYWNYLGACYWHWDALLMAEMAAATGRDAGKYRIMADSAKDYVRGRFLSEGDGMLAKPLAGMQTPALFALKFGFLEGTAKAKTVELLRRNFAERGDCLQTGFLGTSILMETLCANGMTDLAYTLLLQHNNPSWLYSVDQGATTIWERWNSYTREGGFGPVGMNSFNHYAYGAVLAWLYKDVAGIAADPRHPGFRNIVMAPKPDRRLGWVDARYDSASGTIKSAWRYEGDDWLWDFTIPDGATADVTLPGKAESVRYAAGTHHIRQKGL